MQLSVDNLDALVRVVDGCPIAYSASSLETLLTCPRKFQYSRLEGWARPSQGVVTGFGSLIHAALEEYETLRFYGVGKAEAVNKVFVKLMELGEAQKKVEESRDYDIFSAARAFLWYTMEYHYEPYETLATGDGKPSLELEFEVPLHEDWRLIGIFDKLAVYKEDGKIWAVDHKTTKQQLSTYYFDFFKPNTQVYAYVWALREMLDAPIGGFLVDAIQTQVQSTNFFRYQVPVTDEQLDEWHRDTVIMLENTRRYAKEGYWPMQLSGCGAKGGCEFREICKKAPHVRERLLPYEFVQRGGWIVDAKKDSENA